VRLLGPVAVAVVAYEMLTGAHPFDGKSPAEWLGGGSAALFTPVTKYVPQSPQVWQELFVRTFAHDSSQRPQSAETLLRIGERLKLTKGCWNIFTFFRETLEEFPHTPAQPASNSHPLERWHLRYSSEFHRRCEFRKNSFFQFSGRSPIAVKYTRPFPCIRAHITGYGARW